MPSITAWNRLESSTRATELETGLQARVADPLWLLARQWQLGEFLGEDACSPVEARIDLERTRLSRIRMRRTKQASRVVGLLPAGPLEAIVEREPPLSGAATRERAIESGQHFLRMLTRHGDDTAILRQKFRDAFPVTGPTEAERPDLDAESERFLGIMADRAVDGAALREAVAAAGDAVVPPSLTLDAATSEIVKAALTEWVTWYDARFSTPEGDVTAWVSQRMEYAFDVAAPLADRELVLNAPEYPGGYLDWYAFDISTEKALDATPQTSATTLTSVRLLPAPLSYPGMPASRFWNFEDTRVHMARYSAGAADISKLLLVEFAMVYGDDWFRVPIDVELGDLVRIDCLVVRDNFGDETFVPPATQVDGRDSPWRLFVMNGDPALKTGEDSAAGGGVKKGPWLFRAPSLARGLSSQLLEEVVFARDEMANLGWAIERTVENAAGRPVSRAERWLAQQRTTTSTETAAATTTTAEADARYRLQTTVPDYWLPLVPVKYGKDLASIILRRGLTLLPSGKTSPPPKGRILEPDRKLLIFEEEVPGSGINVTRHWQLARWIDGSTWLWLARRKGQGRGEKSSGLRYDLIDEQEPHSVAGGMTWR